MAALPCALPSIQLIPVPREPLVVLVVPVALVAPVAPLVLEAMADLSLRRAQGPW